MTDARQRPRRKTRLKPVKLVTLEGIFLEDGSARDLSFGGVRIIRFAEGPLPARLLIIDPMERLERTAILVWSRRFEAGFRFHGSPRRVCERRVRALTSDFYAVLG